MRRQAWSWLLLISSTLGAQGWAQTLTVNGSNSPYVISTPASFAQVTVADGGVLRANAELTVTGDCIVQGGGTLTVDPAVTNTLRLTVAGNLVVNVGGSIDLTSKGLAPGTTVNPATGAVVPYVTPNPRGGSHFARGSGSNEPGPPSFDEPTAPRLPGSGGTHGIGGGALLATAATLRVDGRITADAEDRSLLGGDSGAGGTINLTTTSLSGMGLLSAQGGGMTSANGHTSAGGLILLSATASTFSGAIAVNGSPGGAAGSGLLLGPHQVLTVLAGDYPLRYGQVFSSLALRPGTTVTVSGRATITAPLVVGPGTTLVLRSPDALDAVACDTVDGTLQVEADVSSSLPLHLHGHLVLNQKLTVPRLDTVAGAVITHSPQVTSMHLVVLGALDLVAGARIDVQGMGLPSDTTIDSLNLTPTRGVYSYNGGSHAGLGGWADSNFARAPAYDDPNAPRFAGGGGGSSFSGVAAGQPGGGVIRLTASSARIDGLVLADGAGGSSGGGSGSGAGGTIALVAGSLSGSGQLLARGYAGAATVVGGGGGGIINLAYSTSTFTGVKSVAGGVGQAPGAPGVIVENTLTVGPTIVSTPANEVRVGQLYTYAPVATGTAPLTWSLVTGPTDATVDPSTGLVRWTPQLEGAAAFDLSVSNSLGTAHQTFAVVVLQPPLITSTAGQMGAVGRPYHYDADDTAAASGSAPLSWSVLLGPAGLTIEQATGRVAWVPANAGTLLTCLEVRNAVGQASQCFAVAVTSATEADAGTEVDAGTQTDAGTGAPARPRLVSAPGTVATCGVAYRYSAQRVPQVEGTGPFTFSVHPTLGLALPEGLSVDASSGELSWTPTPAQVGVNPLELRVDGPGGSDAQQFAIVVECPPAKKLEVCGCSSGAAPVLFALALWLHRRRASAARVGAGASTARV